MPIPPLPLANGALCLSTPKHNGKSALLLTEVCIGCVRVSSVRLFPVARSQRPHYSRSSTHAGKGMLLLNFNKQARY